VLLPLLSALPQPLALIEVGASAGLCLYPDRYSYRYGDVVIDPDAGPSAVLIDCAATGPVPLPASVPRIAWRAGLDLNPLDVDDDSEMAWLETLVWPEHDARRARLRAAIDIARADPPHIVKADAIEGIAALAAQAPADATLVIFHSAVVAYFAPEERQSFVDAVAALPGHWISNEGQGVVPGVRERLPRPVTDPALFLLALDGAPVAATGGHGQTIEWL
jgi:hypothetical protein